MTVIALPESAKQRQSHPRLTQWLRELADYIDANDLETEPHAALIVLTGPDQHEAICAGYSDDGSALDGAAYAAMAVTRPHFATEGGNIRKRNHPHYGFPLRKPN